MDRGYSSDFPAVWKNKDRFRFEPISVFVYICEIDQSHDVI